MSGYWICHQALHVANGKECTRTPYGALELYDTACHPVGLKLVGLVPKERADDLADLPDEVICVKRTHRSPGFSCTQSPVPRSHVVRLSNGHEFVPFYAQGQWVLLQGRVLKDSNDVGGVTIALRGAPNSTNAPRESILGLTDGPIPSEPDRKLILKSQPNGRVFSFTDSWRELPAANGASFTWEELYNLHGPFNTFSPDGTV